MSARTAKRLVVGFAALTLAMVAVSTALTVTSGLSWEVTGSIVWAFALVFTAVGGLIATRHPANPIGWIFISAGVASGLALLSGAYADYWLLAGRGSATLGRLAAAYSSLAWIPFILPPTTFLLLLFPDGRLPGPRWRIIGWAAALGIGLGFVSSALAPGPLEDFTQIQNPYGVNSSAIDPLTGLAFLFLLVGMAGSAAALVVRFRRAGGEQRQQIKWLALVGALAVLCFPLALLGSDPLGGIAYAPLMLSVLGLPVAAGIAILRYRLYDIDVVINRTLVYGGLTATLAAVYLGTVLVFQLALGGITEESNLAIAGSTLAVAALFRPARSRIQDLVDRRFYRRRYDAQRTLESFSSRLRDEVDLAALDLELRGVVAETMQPASVSLWLRETGR